MSIKYISFFVLIFNVVLIRGDLDNSNNKENYQGPKKISKRLETIDGVEIASSYKEYLDLALDDLEDRLKKSSLKLADFRQRIEKRTSLLNEIDKEIKKRKEFSIQLSEKDKILRTRLLRNTEMKSALQNLADIAGYKLSAAEKEKFYSDLSANQLNENLTNALVNRINDNNNKKGANGGSYTRYIEMAYSEVESILIKDKQTLIEVIRNLKTNEIKLKELEKLKLKVNSSLARLNEYNANLINIINRDRQIETTVQQLESQIKINSQKMINQNKNKF